MKLPPVLSRETDGEAVRLSFDIRDDLDCFRGHFPEVSVLPGVVQLHWAVVVAREHFGMTGNPLDVQRLKFKSIVVPPAVVELELIRTSVTDVRFGYTSPGQAHSEGRLRFPGNGQ